MSNTTADAGAAVTNGDESQRKANTPHYHFIHSMILPSTVKIQRALTGRKFKDLQTKLTETIQLLQKFQYESWEPEEIVTTSSKEESDDDSAVHVSINDGDEEATAASELTEDTGKTTTTTISTIEDDPLTRMPMHHAVQVALEAYRMTISHPAMSKSSSKPACEQALECIEQLVVREYVVGCACGHDEEAGKESPPLQKLLGALHSCSELALKMTSIHSHIARCIKAIMTSQRCGIHKQSMLFGIRIAFHSYLVTDYEPCRKASKEALLDIVEHYLQRLEDSNNNNSLWYTDCFYMLRSFVKLSSKDLEGMDEGITTATAQKSSYFWESSALSVNTLALQNKILSLELQLQAMECAGPKFCNGDKFIQLVQSQNGSIALFKNCMSQCPQVAYISQRLFLILAYKFKNHLKDEIGAFMSNIFFRVIESENSSFTQKAVALESLRSLCNDPFLLSQIFLNYDCDFDSMNLYKDIVFHLAQLCARSTMASMEQVARSKQKDADQNAELSLAGVEVLVTILQTFLKALGIPTNAEESIDTAGTKIRRDLGIQGVVANSKRQSSNFLKYRQKYSQMITSSALSTHEKSTHGGSAAASSVDSEDNDSSHDNDLTGTILGSYEKKRNAEQNLELGVVKFTMDLKKGLNFFIDNGFVACDAKEIARFFLDNKDRLDKTQMGEALGREPDAAFIKGQPDLDPDKGGPGFFFRILHHYTMSLDFTDMFFAEAIRLFLSGFRLPGEAQKIDRIMEKFAERYTIMNPDVFPSADTAFILAFSVIMLNTDLHNPSIKPERRMTIESFIRNNRGIGENGVDLDPELLTSIFNRIKEKPFSLKEDDVAREKGAEATSQALGDNGGLLGAGLFGSTVEERKKEKFKKEREDMVVATELLIRRKKERSTKAENLTDTVDPGLVVKPMFDVTWGAMIGTLSQVMEMSNDERSLSVCLNGFVYAIRISAQSNMSLARDTFLNSLAKFTYLGSGKELKRKNLEIIRTLIGIAVTDGEYLGESWGPVLQCISQIARMRMSASGLDNDEAFLQNSTHSGSSSAKTEPAASRSMFARETKADVLKETESTNSRIVLNAISEQLIDQVFSSSVKLPAQSLALFIEQLIAVANSEIEGVSKSGITGVSTNTTNSSHGESGPSIFSMQRLLEVADYNMHLRPRLVWTQIWDVMAGFFSKNGCHSNPMVSVFAVDALKQLSLKFLEKPEGSEFHFQRLFLEPFLDIMKSKDARQETREVILACVDQMIHTRVDNLRSGWRVFFDILTAGANDPNSKVSLQALSILQSTLDKHLDKLSVLVDKNEDEMGKSHNNSHAEDFLAMCNASLSFIDRKGTPHPMGVSIRALCHTAIYADLIAGKRVFAPVSGAQFEDSAAPGYTYGGLNEQEALDMILWRPLFEGLAKGVKATSRSKDDGIGNLVQCGSVLALRAILLRHGSTFSNDQLHVILKETVIPAFQIAVEGDDSPVVSIASESPSISSLDFLADPLPLPPTSDDDGLLKFEQVVQQSDRNARPMGSAELLLEAMFTVLRNGGRGDLSEAYKLAKKDIESREDDKQQPFPDSWISTTAPIALGTLTDLSTEVLIVRGSEGAIVWRSTIAEVYQHWCNGDITKWVPCEAVVRIATSEFERFMMRATEELSTIVDKKHAKMLANLLIDVYADILGKNLGVEQIMMDMLLEEKRGTSNHKKKSTPNVTEFNKKSYEKSALSGSLSEFESQKKDCSEDEAGDGDEPTSSEVGDEANDYGDERAEEAEEGSSVEDQQKIEEPETQEENIEDVSTSQPDSDEFVMLEQETQDRNKEELTIQLDYGTLQRPDVDRSEILSTEVFAKLDGKSCSSDAPKWMKLLPALKLRCVAAHYLQHILLLLREETLIRFISQNSISNLLKTLNTSRGFAEDAVKNEDLAHAFQEAMFCEWGISEDMGEEALEHVARLNNIQGSAMFFLTQTASATNGVIRLLSDLYDYEEITGDEDEQWDRRVFAGQYLLKIKQDIFRKFAESEAKEGHKVDPNVWRNTTESGIKVAIYCTSFASVVAGLLKAMLSFEPTLIERNKAAIFPLVCELVGVRSEEIRKLVRRVLTEKFGPLLGLGQDTGGMRSMRASIESKDSFSLR